MLINTIFVLITAALLVAAIVGSFCGGHPLTALLAGGLLGALLSEQLD